MPTAKFGGSQPPKVTLVTRFKSEKVETQTVGIVADVTDQGGGYRTPWLRHNGVVIAATLPPETRPNGIRQTFEVTLVDGQNKLEVLSASADGSWESREAGRTYGTAMMVLAFTVPYRQLPIYQRDETVDEEP